MSPMTPLIMMCRFPHLLFDEKRRQQIELTFNTYQVRVRTWSHIGTPFLDRSRRVIEIGWPFCERLWAHLCGYLAVFEWHERSGRPASIIPFVEDPQNAAVLRLFEWALEGETIDRMENLVPWPKDTPQPPAPKRMPVGFEAIQELLEPDLVKHFEGRVTRAFQRAVGWIFLHEFAHLAYGHTDPLTSDPPAHIGVAVSFPSDGPSRIRYRDIESMLQEQEADHFASNTSFDMENDEDEWDRSTLMGVVGLHAMIGSSTLTPFDRPSGLRSHVDPLTRLRRFLRTFQQKSGLGWIAASLFLELELWGNRLPSGSSESFGTDAHICRVYEIAGGKVA